MFGKKKAYIPQPAEEKKEKPTPAYLREDYPCKAAGCVLGVCEIQNGVVYEIWCDKCQMSIWSRGYERCW